MRRWSTSQEKSKYNLQWDKDRYYRRILYILFNARRMVKYEFFVVLNENQKEIPIRTWVIEPFAVYIL